MSERLLLATLLAERAHRHQTRQSDGCPYLIHPLRVAQLVAEHLPADWPEGEDVVIAAVLHDTLEDTTLSAEQITAQLGPRVTALVEEVTNPSLGKVDKKRWQVEHATTLSRGACLIKMADKLDNLRDHLQTPIWGLRRTQGYLLHAREVVDRMPHSSPALRAALDQIWAEGVIRAADGEGPALDPHLTLEEWYADLQPAGQR